MKFTAPLVSIAAMAASTSAFTAPTTKTMPSTQLKISDKAIADKSQSLPWLDRPEALDGTYQGDVGFDPFGFAKNKEDLRLYREAEIKHARLAMLAAVGWPISELLDRTLANAFGWQTIVDATDRAPSVLNGGLGKISPVYWAGVITIAAAIDLIQLQKSRNNPTYTPGNLNFDPLGLYPDDKEGQDQMKLAEIKNGRLAMLAITAFALQEAVTHMGVIDNPFFIHSLN
ncbi:fucoxanthin chlorophyll a/c protein [Nitzschia inconspicua]|uniref:Fucoxanthin chlorophyll a/c protein n=1 Tax=Nitzschia inconspicua TaxID=303405 RepID=A0A9K3KWN5_9STRA|nr:fucoxanthin chlorophyll a/c protein [Nitzschia inconspicua]